MSTTTPTSAANRHVHKKGQCDVGGYMPSYNDLLFCMIKIPNRVMEITTPIGRYYVRFVCRCDRTDARRCVLQRSDVIVVASGYQFKSCGGRDDRGGDWSLPAPQRFINFVMHELNSLFSECNYEVEFLLKCTTTSSHPLKINHGNDRCKSWNEQRCHDSILIFN